MQVEYHAKGKKLYMCFVDIENAFDRLEVLVRSVMSLYEGAKTKVRVDSELSEEIEVKVGMHQGSVLSPFLFIHWW